MLAFDTTCTPYFKDVRILAGDPIASYVLQVVQAIQRRDAKFVRFELEITVSGTFTGKIGEVTEDGIIGLDGARLSMLPENVQLAIIAHELAHAYLGHHFNWKDGDLQYEDEADNLAKEWGFDVDAFRRIVGPAKLQ